jgi:hypothetical protein
MKFNKDSNYQEILDTFSLKAEEFERVFLPLVRKYCGTVYPGELKSQVHELDLLKAVKEICKAAGIDDHVKQVVIFCKIDELIINEI